MKAAWLETLAFLDPEQKITITGPNGKTAQGIATSFLQSQKLKGSSYDSSLPAMVELLREDATRLAIADRSSVTIAGHKLTVIVIGDDPIDPCVQLTLTQFS